MASVMTLFQGDNPLLVQARVIGALVLRDLRTRFGRTAYGSLIVVAWPLFHLFGLTTIFVLTRRTGLVGTDTAVFVGTGVLPYILCFYPARMIMLCVFQNKTLLGLPIVKTPDIIIARGIVEVVAAFWVTAIFFLIMYIFGVEVIPIHAEEAILAVLATVYLGFAMGFLGAVMYGMVRAWIAVQFGWLIVLYMTSGVFFLPTSLPERLRNILWFNPLVHSVEWLRSAYYEGYGYGMLSKPYLIGFATLIFFIGLLVERGVRGRLLEH
jgi:capsular polysaccharide transport system permease protein